jgi:hypothetical protein
MHTSRRRVSVHTSFEPIFAYEFAGLLDWRASADEPSCAPALLSEIQYAAGVFRIELQYGSVGFSNFTSGHDSCVCDFGWGAADGDLVAGQKRIRRPSGALQVDRSWSFDLPLFCRTVFGGDIKKDNRMRVNEIQPYDRAVNFHILIHVKKG